MESEEKDEDFDPNEINLAEVRTTELQACPPYICTSLKPVKGKKG